MINQVYLDEAGNYSVKGYNTRLENSFGKIYLGMDKGEDYDRLATKPNEAIRSITTQDAFDLTLGIARRAVATSQHPREFAIADLVVILNKTLADLCTYWFGLPDDIIMVTGRIRESDIVPPARCPGDFSYTSAAVFKPNPGCMVAIAGQTLGRLLKDAVTQFIAKHRAAKTIPEAALSRAIFEAFPDDDDLIGRTIIGVMMGFLPTTYFNLFFAVKQWCDIPGMFKDLQNRLKENNEPAIPPRPHRAREAVDPSDAEKADAGCGLAHRRQATHARQRRGQSGRHDPYQYHAGDAGRREGRPHRCLSRSSEVTGPLLRTRSTPARAKRWRWA